MHALSFSLEVVPHLFGFRELALHILEMRIMLPVRRLGSLQLLPKFLRFIFELGYKVVTVSDNFSILRTRFSLLLGHKHLQLFNLGLKHLIVFGHNFILELEPLCLKLGFV